MTTHRNMAWKIALSIAIPLVLPLLVQATCSTVSLENVTVRTFPEAWVEISGVEHVEKLAVPLSEVISEGERAYLRSCVRCHGVDPADLGRADRQDFIEVVRNGTLGENPMPALGYKLNAVEAEMIRIYLDNL